MKKILSILFFIYLIPISLTPFCSMLSPTFQHQELTVSSTMVSLVRANPFTSKPQAPKVQRTKISPSMQNGVILTLVKWQQKLRVKMSGLIKETQKTGNMAPILMVLAAAFLYGAVHSAGPGHGKAIALSYILSCKPNLVQGLLFGNILAFAHGLSGMLLVLTVKFILQGSMASSLTTVTKSTQIISFGLITCLGLFLVFRTLYNFKSKGHTNKQPPATAANPSFWSAVAVGMIPCPGVVMVMLFAISMNLVWLGILLGFALSFGMATTLSFVVLLGMSGKTALMSGLSNHAKLAFFLEHAIEGLAGLMVAILGSLFLLASLQL